MGRDRRGDSMRDLERLGETLGNWRRLGETRRDPEET